MKPAKYYSTKPVGSYTTSILFMDKDYNYLYEKEIFDGNLEGYCQCLKDLDITYITQKALRQAVEEIVLARPKG